MLCHISSSHRIDLDFCYHERTNHICIIFSNLSLWEVYENDFSLIHCLSDREFTSRLSKDISYQTRGKKLTYFVGNWSDSFFSLLVLPFIKFIVPKLEQKRIFYITNDLITKFLVCQHSQNMHERCIWVVDNREYDISQNIFQSWSPWVFKEFLEGRNHSRGEFVFFCFVVRLQ